MKRAAALIVGGRPGAVCRRCALQRFVRRDELRFVDVEPANPTFGGRIDDERLRVRELMLLDPFQLAEDSGLLWRGSA